MNAAILLMVGLVAFFFGWWGCRAVGRAMTPRELELVKHGRETERVAVIAFLRRFTNLRTLATLFEDRAHFALTEKELREYAAEKGLLLR